MLEIAKNKLKLNMTDRGALQDLPSRAFGAVGDNNTFLIVLLIVL